MKRFIPILSAMLIASPVLADQVKRGGWEGDPANGMRLPLLNKPSEASPASSAFVPAAVPNGCRYDRFNNKTMSGSFALTFNPGTSVYGNLNGWVFGGISRYWAGEYFPSVVLFMKYVSGNVNGYIENVNAGATSNIEWGGGISTQFNGSLNGTFVYGVIHGWGSCNQ